MTLLCIKNLSVDFALPNRTVNAVRNISLNINKGETVALVGESGSGKSATALSILQLLPYPRATHPRGSIEFEGTELIGAPEKTMQRIRGDKISMIFQEPMTSLNPLHTIGKQVAETLVLHRSLRPNAARREALELLHMVRLNEAKSRFNAWPHQLSGGERQRVMIAMALANNPSLLIADEPTTALDVTIQAEILHLLRRLQAELGMATLLITHDLTIVRDLAERTYVMHNGTIVESGQTPKLFANPRAAYTKTLLKSQPTDTPANSVLSRSTITETRDLKAWFPIRKGLLRRTTGHIKAVDGISLLVRQGETLGIVGESGSGKTTLCLAILRLISSKGFLEFEGKNIQGKHHKSLLPVRRKMQIVFQDPFASLSPRLSVQQIIEEGLKIHKIGDSPADRTGIVSEALLEVGLIPEDMDRYPHEFSGGQRQRIGIARSLATEPKIIIADEPVSALDVSIQAQVINLMMDLQEEFDLTILFIAHDLSVVKHISTEVAVMYLGELVEYNKTKEIFNNPQHDYTKKLLSAIPQPNPEGREQRKKERLENK